MAPRDVVYALLALAGLAGTWYFNLVFAAAGGSFLDLRSVLGLAFANPISSSFSADLFVAFAAFVVFAIAEARRIGMRRGWLYPLLGLVVAFAFAFPLFLFARERALRRQGGIH